MSSGAPLRPFLPLPQSRHDAWWQTENVSASSGADRCLLRRPYRAIRLSLVMTLASDTHAKRCLPASKSSRGFAPGENPDPGSAALKGRSLRA